jgi:hypothetical protein
MSKKEELVGELFYVGGIGLIVGSLVLVYEGSLQLLFWGGVIIMLIGAFIKTLKEIK